MCGCRLISRGIHQEPFKSALHQTKLISRRYIEFGIVPPMQAAVQATWCLGERPNDSSWPGLESATPERTSLNFCYLIGWLGHVITFLYTRHISDFSLAPSLLFFLGVRCCYFLYAPQSDSRGPDWHSQYKFVSDGGKNEKSGTFHLSFSLWCWTEGEEVIGSEKSFLARDWGRK